MITLLIKLQNKNMSGNDCKLALYSQGHSTLCHLKKQNSNLITNILSLGICANNTISEIEQLPRNYQGYTVGVEEMGEGEVRGRGLT